MVTVEHEGHWEQMQKEVLHIHEYAVNVNVFSQVIMLHNDKCLCKQLDREGQEKDAKLDKNFPACLFEVTKIVDLYKSSVK